MAPDYEAGALEILKKKRNLRILAVDPVVQGANIKSYDLRPITGGMLVQIPDVID